MPDDMLTCLTCGRYQGAETAVRSPSPGWVQTGGFAGPLLTCECCGGRGMHDPRDGCPKCHTYPPMEAKRRWLRQHPEPAYPDTIKRDAYTAAVTRWDIEAEPRTLALLTNLYGADVAEQMMALDPPL